SASPSAKKNHPLFLACGKRERTLRSGMLRGATAMPMLRFLLLGPVRLETAQGKSVAGVGPKGRALLAYLAAQPDGRAERDRLAGLLWDNDQAQARHALRQMLLVLRRKLGAYALQVLVNDGS